MTSSPNTNPEQQDDGSEGANLPVPVTAPHHNTSLTRVQASPTDAQVADLQRTLEREREGRLEERWVWLAGVGLLFVMLCFSAIGAVAGGVCFMVYLMVIAVMGKRWGIDGILETLAAVQKFVPGAGKEE